MNILVSACLLGVNCRYDGAGKAHPDVLALLKDHTLIPVCPEQLGGLPTPRPPAERVEEQVVTNRGGDVTAAFQTGARETLRLAELTGCTCAVLKARSPSCGSDGVYDGAFTGRVVPGDGVTAALLREHGIRVVSEENLPDLE